MARYGGPKKALAQYLAVVRTVPDAVLRGATIPYTTRNGHMYSFLDQRGLMGLRLPASRREEFILTFRTDLATQCGAVIRDYVEVPGWLLADTEVLRPWFEESHRWIGSLDPRLSLAEAS